MSVSLINRISNSASLKKTHAFSSQKENPHTNSQHIQQDTQLLIIHSVTKNDTDVGRYSFDVHRQIFITFGRNVADTHTHTHAHLTDLCPGLPGWAGTSKGKPNLDFTEARDSEWQWHQLGHMQVCTSLQTDNHANTPPIKFFYRPDVLPAAQPTVSKHWRQNGKWHRE